MSSFKEHDEHSVKGQKLLQELEGASSCPEKISNILAQFKVVTRERSLSPELLDQNCLETLVKYAKDSHMEAQKSLSNIIMNYAHLREPLVEPYSYCVRARLENINNGQSDAQKTIASKKKSNEILYYDLRIIFLLSALCPNSRTLIRERLADLIFKQVWIEADNISEYNQALLTEGLKALFNLTLDQCVNKDLAGHVVKKLFEAVQGRETTLGCETRTQIIVSLIHLLTNMPHEVYLRLSIVDANKILTHLDNQLKTLTKQNFRDSVLPVLNVCANICKFNDEIRKNWFEIIMTSSTDFDKRPEKYDTLRGRLVKLMTSVDVHIKDIAADFLYQLCGCDTVKFITYTGFGNSAAFLAARGLLTKGSHGEPKASSSFDEDRSYRELRHKIDPITGKIETPRVNSMAEMSQEEKEFRADELANAITKLSNLGVMKPMSIDADGNLSDLRPKNSDAKKS